MIIIVIIIDRAKINVIVTIIAIVTVTDGQVVDNSLLLLYYTNFARIFT